MKLKTFDMAKIEEKAFIAFLLEQGLLAITATAVRISKVAVAGR